MHLGIHEAALEETSDENKKGGGQTLTHMGIRPAIRDEARKANPSKGPFRGSCAETESPPQQPAVQRFGCWLRRRIRQDSLAAWSLPAV